MSELARGQPIGRQSIGGERDAKMTQDQRLDVALAKLTAAMASLEAATGKIRDLHPPMPAAEPGLDAALEQAVSKVERLEAANEEVSHVLKGAIDALAAILSRQAGPTED
jgi:hypothetical protein